MALSDMYTAMPGSPKTKLSADITAAATTITVESGSALPVAPNLAVIGDNENAEVVYYGAKNGNTLSSVTRGLGGTTASAWESGMQVARTYTSFDHDRFIENIQTLQNEKLSSVNLTSNVSGVLPAENGGTGNQTGTANLAATTADASSELYPVGVTSGATSTLKRDTSVSMTGGTVTATTFSGALSGNASTATKLATARTVRTNLASTSTASFDGSANITPGVTGTLPIANGGTNATSATGSSCAASQLFPDNVGTDATYFFTRTNSYAKVGYSTLANIKTLLGVDDSGEKSLASDVIGTGGIYYRKVGATVVVWGTFTFNSNITSNTGYTIATIGSAYRPSRDVWVWAGNPSTTYAEAGSIVIGSGGVLKFYKPASLSTWTTGINVHFSATYFV